MHPDSLYLKGGDHAVMLLHGVCGTHLELMITASWLNRAGFTVVVPFLPGYTYGQPSVDYQSWILQACAVYDELRQMHQSVSVVGLSMGATLALAVAERVPDIAALVLLSTTLYTDGWAMPWYRFLLGLAWHTPLRSSYAYHERPPYGIKNIELRTRVKKALMEQKIAEVGGQEISLEHLHQAAKLSNHARDHLDLVQADTLLVHSIDDETASPSNAEEVLAGIASPRKEVIYLGDCYHMITVDNERETVNYETERFIKEAVNLKMRDPVFEMPEILSKELLRAARRAAG
ncbi:MAG: alpha/beta fold hydrolase [Candidatus Protistobacter heckmanni]|nr:alpha/beta fold hydrolase [Candidatus Protistobacter heckmanni]